MAIETALKFLERLDKESSLRGQLYISQPKDMDELLRWAQGKGFVISEDDLTSALGHYQERFPTGNLEPVRRFVSGSGLTRT